MDWMLMPLRRYADFAGRSQRKEYWLFVLGYTILFAVLGALGGGLVSLSSWTQDSQIPVGSMLTIGLLLVLALALFIPSLAVTIRRFHDQDRTGWWVLIVLVPYLGGLILIVFMCIEGTRGPNRFGEDPKAIAPAY